jgi:methyltransferase
VLRLMRPILLLVLAFVPMLAESRVSARNTRALLAGGAREPRGDVFAVMQVVYPACFLAMVAEGWMRGGVRPGALAAGAAVFVLAKGLKYWAIATLGPRWSFRVLVPPQAKRIARGPYRFMRHPNYVGVAGELAGVAMMAPAPVTGLVSLGVFGALMAVRIRVEERALAARDRGADGQ